MSTRSTPITEGEVRMIVLEQHVERTKLLYKDTDYVDLLIKCGDREFRVHKAIVCIGCYFFRVACKKGKGGGFKESYEGVITLSADGKDGGDDPEVIALVIEYLYKTDYSSKQDLFLPPNDQTLVTHAKVFATAEKFNVDGLKMLAHVKFKDTVKSSNISPFTLAELIRAVFNTTPETVMELRDEMKEYLVGTVGHVMDSAEVQSAVESVEGLAYELFRKTQKKVLLTPKAAKPIPPW